MDLYYLPASTTCRSVLMTAKSIGIELNKKYTDLQKGDQLKPEYIKMNPQHTIPTLNDNGFCIWESRAIMIYLAEKYAKTDSLYPADPRARALINQRLYFDMNLYNVFAAYFYPPTFRKVPVNEDLKKRFEAQLEILNAFLEGQTFAAGKNLTLADLALLATVSTFYVANIDLSKYGNIKKWYEYSKGVTPGFEENWQGCLEFKKYMDNL